MGGWTLLMAVSCSKGDTPPPPKISVVPDTVIETRAVPAQGDSMPSSLNAPAPAVTAADNRVPHGLLIPVPGVKWLDLRDSFHEMRGTRIHNALDIMAPRGTPILSTDDGVLLKMHNSIPGGLTAYAADPTRHFVYMYGHLDSYYPALREGQALKRGDTVGFVGSTGNAAAAGPHLHFAVARNDDMTKWWMGTPIDPRPLLH